MGTKVAHPAKGHKGYQSRIESVRRHRLVRNKKASSWLALRSVEEAIQAAGL